MSAIPMPRIADAFSAHTYFMTNPSLSGRGRALKISEPRPVAIVTGATDVGRRLRYSDHTKQVSGKQTTWLQKALKEGIHSCIALPSIMLGAYPSTAKFDGRVSRRVKKYWVPFEKYGVHACFENHNHAYKRTYPLRNGKRDKTGVTYFGDGAWGVKPRKSQILKKHLHYFAHTVPKQQVMIVELSEKKRSFWAMDVKGKVFDFVVQRVQK